DGSSAITRAHWLGAAGQAWAYGAQVDLDVLCPPTGRHIALPPTRFDHTVRWPVLMEPAPVETVDSDAPERYLDPGAWLTRPRWQRVGTATELREREARAVQWLLPPDEARRAWFARLGQVAQAAGRDVLPPLVHIGDSELRRPLDLLWWPDLDGQ